MLISLSLRAASVLGLLCSSSAFQLVAPQPTMLSRLRKYPPGASRAPARGPSPLNIVEVSFLDCDEDADDWDFDQALAELDAEFQSGQVDVDRWTQLYMYELRECGVMDELKRKAERIPNQEKKREKDKKRIMNIIQERDMAWFAKTHYSDYIFNVESMKSFEPSQ
ncbi:unnamed protein product [Vitrella brassicaformis CCMP3155]|uniref:Uncharacterized protein n=1 Tax=Vitrella brassicaformis (strain CCMP3155) TaxID=1169540 RepID=A0A0G4FDF1_VITBC|nr:unnamed protein product [Vitrella brassicaformis CCMP3155]|eukprot:CEM11247.1 unnamed protein product [Vitrella brassicaformis CCMP3155]